MTTDAGREVANLTKGRLRLPGGTEAEFIRPRHQRLGRHRSASHHRPERSTVLGS
jgi:hypothetical protein